MKQRTLLFLLYLPNPSISPSVVGIDPVNWFEPRSSSSSSLSWPNSAGIVEKRLLSKRAMRSEGNMK
jgi:hypothetical protein